MTPFLAWDGFVAILGAVYVVDVVPVVVRAGNDDELDVPVGSVLVVRAGSVDEPERPEVSVLVVVLEVPVVSAGNVDELERPKTSVSVIVVAVVLVLVLALVVLDVLDASVGTSPSADMLLAVLVVKSTRPVSSAQVTSSLSVSASSAASD